MTTSFKPPSKSFTVRDYLFIGLVVILFSILSILLFSANLKLAQHLGGGGEFYLPWVGGRAFTIEHVEPYSLYVPQKVQELVYGHAAQTGQEPYILDIPFHLLILFLPYSFITDPQAARAFFTLLSEFALCALALLSLRLTEWEAPRIFPVLFFLLCIFNFYTLQALLEATPVLMLGLVYAGILLALRAEQDELAGALIALSCFQWEVGGPFLLLVFLRVIDERRGRTLAGFGMVTFILLAVSFLWYPNWIMSFLRATVNNLKADFGFNAQVICTHFWPDYGSRIAWALTVLLIIVIGYEWNIARRSDFRRFYWAACLTLAATPLLGFRTEMENLSTLILPLAFVFAVTQARWKRIGDGLSLLLLLLVFALPWGLYFFALPRFGKMAEEILFLFYPLFTIIGLYWIRWWAIRPPRIWYEPLRNK